MNSSAAAYWQALSSSFFVALFFAYKILFFIVSSIKYVDCETYPTCFLQPWLLKETSLSSNLIFPESGVSKPEIISISVVLPDPLSPIKHTHSFF